MSQNIWEDENLLTAMRSIINAVDKNSNREGLEETPKRYLKFLSQFLNPPPFEFTTFEKEKYDQMVTVSHIPFFSICEHHLAPFFGLGHIAYIPNDKGRICGLSKLPRALDKFANRFQNQERITTEVCEFLHEKLEPKGVIVSLKARHLCVEMRGVKKSSPWTTTTAMKGAFEDAAARKEFFDSINMPTP